MKSLILTCLCAEVTPVRSIILLQFGLTLISVRSSQKIKFI